MKKIEQKNLKAHNKCIFLPLSSLLSSSSRYIHKFERRTPLTMIFPHYTCSNLLKHFMFYYLERNWRQELSWRRSWNEAHVAYHDFYYLLCSHIWEVISIVNICSQYQCSLVWGEKKNFAMKFEISMDCMPNAFRKVFVYFWCRKKELRKTFQI